MRSKFSTGLFLLAMGLPMLSQAQAANEWRSALGSAAPTATPSSGDYNTASNWQKFDGTTWNAATAKPGTSNTALLTVLTGSNMTIAASSGSNTMLVQTGASIKWIPGTTAAQGLRFSGNSLVNNGTIGGNVIDDSINIEVSGNGVAAVISGTGTTTVNRIRVLGALQGTSVTITQPLLTVNNQTGTFGSAVGLTGFYGSSSTAADYDTVTIAQGSTVMFTRGATLHWSSVTNPTNVGGKYFYNINGTADMSQSVGTTYISPIATTATSLVSLTVSGLLKLGAAFSTMDSSLYNGTPATPTPGSISLNVLAGGVVDATPTDFKMDNNYAAGFTMAPTAVMKRYISTTTFAKYAIATSALGNNTLSIQNIGTADTFSVNIANAFDFANAPTDLTKVVAREWTIKEAGNGGKMDSLKFTWLAAEQGSAVGTTPSVYVRPASGGTQVEYVSGTNVTVSGAGTIASPYLAVVSVPAGAPAGKYFIGVAGLPTAVANVANATDLNVTVAPNPTTNKQISYKISGSQAGVYHVAVYNVLGQAVYNSDVNYNANTTTYKIDLSNAPTGIYQVQISNATTKIGKRVVVE